MAKIISITEAKKHLLKLSRRNQEFGETFLIVRDSEPVSALIPFDEYESMVETLHILEDEPDVKRKLVAAEKEIARGKFTTWAPPVKRKRA